ncbi:MAG: hypothetical protein KJO21_01295 [Verrucomicrobiae bacterium]|nr:hypothetical protein [Verrucomicrobiae bacterium]NNJ42169.1 hypothetical protein [Akkermansiaceae bacterium]
MKTTLKNQIVGVGALTAFTLAAFIMVASPIQAQASSDVNKSNANANVRIMKNQDGSYTEFRRSSDERVIERRTYGDRAGGSGDRVLRMSVIYRKDVYGKLRSGRVHDGSGKVLYRVVYGYRKSDGKLAAEDMFDARVKRTKAFQNPQTKKWEEKEVPVRRLYHRYDAQGRPSKPIVFCAPAGKTAEKLFGKDKGSYEGADPWANDHRTINPNARPTQ